MPGDSFKIYYGKDLSNGSIVSLQNLRVAGSASEVRTIGNVTLVIPTGVPLRSRLVPPVVVAALAIGAEVCAIRSGWSFWLLIPILLVAIWVLRLEKVDPVIDTSVMPSEGPGGEGKTWYRLPSGRGGEAERFVEALGIAERVRETWPKMGHMVDPSEADPLMARALWDLAGVLNRHSKARSIAQRLKEHDRTGIPRDSPALRDRRDVLKRASKLLKREGVAVDAHIARLRRTAELGEALLRETEIAREAQNAYDTLPELYGPIYDSGGDFSGRLAEQTEAVISAYRELRDMYGSGM